MSNQTLAEGDPAPVDPLLSSEKQQSSGRKFDWRLAAVVLFLLLTRIPYLSNGYGDDPDGWCIINAAQRMAREGRYFGSRSPYYPVVEIAYAGIQWSGPFGCNLATAAMGTVAFLFFILILKQYRCSTPYLCGAAFAFIPIVYLNTTCPMDYMWALAFILAGMYCVLRQRSVWAGVCLGLAIGCRMTSGAMLLPLLVLWPRENGKNVRKSMIVFVAGALITGAIAYQPPFWCCGDNFSFYEGAFAWSFVLEKATSEIWGQIGKWALAALAIGCFLAMILAWMGKLFPLSLPIKKIGQAGKWYLANSAIPAEAAGMRQIAGWSLAVVLYAIAFLRLPCEAAYLIPLLPFLLLLLARATNRHVFRVFCLLLIASPFYTVNFHPEKHGLETVSIDRYGTMQANASYRQRIFERARQTVEKTKDLPEKSIVLTAYYLPMVAVAAPPETKKRIEYIAFISKAEIDKGLLDKLIAQGHSIYYMSHNREFDAVEFGVDFSQYPDKVKPIPIDIY